MTPRAQGENQIERRARADEQTKNRRTNEEEPTSERIRTRREARALSSPVPVRSVVHNNTQIDRSNTRTGGVESVYYISSLRIASRCSRMSLPMKWRLCVAASVTAVGSFALNR